MVRVIPSTRASQYPFWISIILILCVASWLRLSSFDFKLPYIDHPDEPSLYVQVLALRGDLSAPIANMAGYPPAVLVQTDIVVRILEAFNQYGSAPAVYVNRLLSVIANLATIVVIALQARLIAGDFAGIVAATAWGISPIIVENGVYGLADPHVYLLSILSVYLASVGLLRPDRRHWVIWSTTAAVLATLYKYPAIVLLLPSALVSLWLLRKDRRMLRTLVIQGALVAALAFFLLVIYNAGSLDVRVTRNAQDSMFVRLLTPSRVLENLWWLTSPLNAQVTTILLIAGTLAFGFAVAFRRPQVRIGAVLLCGVTIIVIAWMVSAYSTPSTNSRIRDVIPATPLACVLIGVAVAQFVLIFPKRLYPVITAIVGAGLYLFIYQAQWVESQALVAERQVIDRRVALFRYVDTSLEPGTIIVSSANGKTFNSLYSGLQGRHWYDWQETDELMERPIEDWMRRGLSYAAVSQAQWEELQQSDEGRAYLDQMMYLRTLNDPPNGDGPQTLMYRLWPMENDVNIGFGSDIQLIGYDINALTFAPGESVELRLYWQASAAPLIDYSLFVHLMEPGSLQPVAQTDGSPAQSERLTPTWTDPDETIISRLLSLPIPETVAPGEYTLNLGLYDYVTGARLMAVRDGEPAVDSMPLLTIEIATP